VSGTLSQIASIAIVVFAVSSMLSVGLAYRASMIIAPLRDARDVFRALLANFVLIPLLAIGIERFIRLEPPLALGLFLLAGSAGAPFLIKLANAAGSDIALSAALLILLVPATVVFLPFYVPLATAHPVLEGLPYAPSSVFELGLPLLSTLILPIVAGLALRGATPRIAAPLVALGSKLATMALIVVIVATFGANFHPLIRILKRGAIVAGVR
jgi:BASS family bile acid:Na+ symporter